MSDPCDYNSFHAALFCLALGLAATAAARLAAALAPGGRNLDGNGKRTRDYRRVMFQRTRQ